MNSFIVVVVVFLMSCSVHYNSYTQSEIFLNKQREILLYGYFNVSQNIKAIINLK